MRIKRHDVPVVVYNLETTIDSEGNAVPTLTLLHTIRADVQPVTAKSMLDAYGVDGKQLRKAFCDLSTDIPLNCIAVVGGRKWQAVAVDEWYDHAEIILTEYRG